MAFASSRTARIGAAILLSLGMTAGLASTVHATGSATKVQVETAADGSGAVVGSQSLASGSSITVYAISRDASDNFVANVSATWSMTSTTGGVATSDLSPTSGLSTVFTGHLVGTGTIHAVASFTGNSGTITVTPGPATKVQVENLASGLGAVLGNQSLASGSSITVYAISRDASNNFVANVSATWSMASTTGGVATSDLSPTSGPSTTFTGDVAGTGTIHAVSGSLTSVDSGTITVTAGPATKVQVETAADGSGSVVGSQSLLSGNSITVYAISRDASNNFVGNPSATWSLTGISGGVVNGDLVGSGASAVFTGHAVGSAVIHAVASFTGNSGTITVTASQVRVETASNGSGSVVSAQSLASGSSITVYAISRDASNNFVANVSATWSLTGITGGVVSGDLVGSGTSAVFTGHLAGTATIHATWDSAAAGNSGIITVIGGTVNAALSTVVASPTSVPANGATTSTITVTLKDAYSNPVSSKTVTLAQYSGPGTPTITTISGTTNGSGVATFTVKSTTAGTDYFQATDATDALVITQTPTVTFTTAQLVVSAPSSAAVGSPFSVTVKAEDSLGNTATGYTGTVHFTSSDGVAVLPANYTFTLADAGNHVFSVTLNTAGTQYVVATDTVTTTLTDSSGPIVVTAASTYHQLTPARLLDTRINLGITGALSANSPASFLVWGRGGVPSNATAVTGNLTVTDSTSGWAVFLGPNSTSSPTSSTINFTAGQILANGVTVALSPTGYLWATYISTTGQTTDLVFDVTGYFTPDTSGAYYHAITPARVLDTRSGIGLSGKFSANTPRTFQVTGTYVPSNAMAVTGNLTVTGSTSGWAVFLGPNSTSSPGSSTINFKTGGIVANNVTVGLSTLGTLSATYISTGSNTTDLVFDVTGYFVQGDTTGARYVPITPARLVDTRINLGITGAQSANVPATFTVWGYGGVPSNALGVTGNLTVTDQTSGWAVFLGPNPNYTPTTSTLNFSAGQVVANGVTVGLSTTGTLSATYISTTGQTTDLVFDVTGYFVH